MIDIIDRIGELVDDQLQQERSGYDHNVNQEKCWHCGREWHGLPITERIAEMYARRAYDEAYSLAEDDSPVLCEGSAFIGPMPCGSTSGLWSDRGPHVQAVTIGCRAGRRGAITVPFPNIVADPSPADEPPAPTRVQFWDREFRWLFTTPVSDWKWATDRTRACFTLDTPRSPVLLSAVEMLPMMITTHEPRRQVWRIDRITDYHDGRTVVEILDVQTELAAIQQLLPRGGDW